MQWLTGFLALYGAVLSTIVAVLQFIRDRPKLRVKVNLGFLSLASDNPKPNLVISLDVQNFGYKAAQLKTACLYMPGFSFITQPTDDLPNGPPIHFQPIEGAAKMPRMIESGESVSISIPLHALVRDEWKQHREEFITILGECRDGLDNIYESEPFRIRTQLVRNQFGDDAKAT
jgi:hypothetical protein